MSYVLLLGDSITQQGFASGWVSQVADGFSRRCDVINRGLSGYNTRWVLQLLKDDKMRQQIVPSFLQNDTFLVTIFFGANDAVAHPSNFQSVPLPEFEANLKQLVYWIRNELHPQHIVLISPPPIDEASWAREKGLEISNRRLVVTREYRDVVIRVANVTETLAIDLFSEMGVPDDACTDDAPWKSLLSDGLHLNELGGRVVSAALLRLLSGLVDLEALPMALPHYTSFE